MLGKAGANLCQQICSPHAAQCLLCRQQCGKYASVFYCRLLCMQSMRSLHNQFLMAPSINRCAFLMCMHAEVAAETHASGSYCETMGVYCLFPILPVLPMMMGRIRRHAAFRLACGFKHVVSG